MIQILNIIGSVVNVGNQEPIKAEIINRTSFPQQVFGIVLKMFLWVYVC